MIGYFRPIWLIIAVLSVVTLFVTGCGGGGDNSTATPGSSSTPTAVKKYDQGVTDSSIKIGSSVNSTGSNPQFGQDVENGLKACVGRVNGDGGINGRQLELVTYDDGFDPARHVANIRRLVEQDQVFALVSPAGTGGELAAMDYIKQKGVIDFGPFLPPDPGLPNVFSTYISHPNTETVLLDYLLNKYPSIKSLGLLYLDNEAGASILDATKAFVASKQLTLKSVPVDLAATDISAQALAVRDANPDAVILATVTAQTPLILNFAADHNWKPIFAGPGTLAGSNVVIKLGGANAENLISTADKALLVDNIPDMVQFRADVAKVTSGAPTDTMTSVYGRCLIFADIVKTMGDEITWANFTSKAETYKGQPTKLAPPMTFGPGPGGHDGVKSAKIIQVQNGQYVALTDYLTPP